MPNCCRIVASPIPLRSFSCLHPPGQFLHGEERVKEQTFPDPLDLNVPSITSDKSIRYDFDIVYVRAPRHGDLARSHWAEIAHPTTMDYGADLMLLHPDGSEEVLVKAEEGCSASDPAVSFDGKWVFYAYFRGLKPLKGDGPPQAASSARIFSRSMCAPAGSFN